MFFCAVGMSQQYKVYGEADGIVPQQFWKINQEKSGALTFWGMNNKTGLTRWDGEKWTYLKFKRDPKMIMSKILSNKDGHVYLSILEKDSMDLSSSFYIDSQIDQEGNLWVHDLGFQSHLFKIVGTEWIDKGKIPLYLFGSPVNEDAAKMFIDKKNNIWIPSMGGLLLYSNDVVTNLTDLFKLKIGFCTFTEDDKGNIWISTWAGGIYKYDGKNFTQYTVKDGLFSDHICSTVIDKNGKLWASHFRGGVSSFDGIKWTNYNLCEQFPQINQIFDASSGLVGQPWSGLPAGLYNSYPSKIIVDSLNNIWYACKGSVFFKFNGDKWELIKLGYNLSSFDMIKDSKGNLWFSYYQTFRDINSGKLNESLESKYTIDSRYTSCLFKYDIKKQELIDIMVGKDIEKLYEDNQGNIWGTTKYGNTIAVKNSKNGTLLVMQLNYVDSLDPSWEVKFPVEIYCFSNE